MLQLHLISASALVNVIRLNQCDKEFVVDAAAAIRITWRVTFPARRSPSYKSELTC